MFPSGQPLQRLQLPRATASPKMQLQMGPGAALLRPGSQVGGRLVGKNRCLACQQLESTWHGPYTLVDMGPLLTYILVPVPSIFALTSGENLEDCVDANVGKKCGTLDENKPQTNALEPETIGEAQSPLTKSPPPRCT